MGLSRIASGRIFADHYQFYVLDSEANPFEGVPMWDEDLARLGYTNADAVFYIGTVAHLNDHWIDVFQSSRVPDLDMCQRAIALPISIPSGRVHIMSPTDFEPAIVCDLEPGRYTAFTLASNIGVDQMSLEEEYELSDAEIERRTDLERYAIVFVPGIYDQTGVVKGNPYLY